MDYKEKVIELLKSQELSKEQKEKLENIFPELVESKDKEIRNFLIDYISHIDWGDWDFSRKQCIDWLEKQCEDKEINNFDVLPGLYKCVHRMFGGTPDSKLLFEVGNVYKCLSKHDRAEFEVSYGHSVYLEDPVVCKHFIPFEKQGEKKSQRMISAEAKEAMYDKPAWSEEDEEHIDSLLKRLDGLCRNEFERTRFAINEDEDWLKSLKQRIGW